MEAALDPARCEAFAARVLAGDDGACQDFIEYVWPVWLGMLRMNRSLGRLSRSEDHVREIATKLVEKFAHSEARGFRHYTPWRERNRDKTFVDWLRIVTTNAARDYVREQLGSRARTSDGPSVKRLLNEFVSLAAEHEHGERPPVTAVETARELLEFARGRLAPEQLSVLALWLEDRSFDEIAVGLHISPDEARRALRAAVAVLRRHFGAP